MTDSRQSRQGWFRAWREHRRAVAQERCERALSEHGRAGEGVLGRRSSAYQHSGPSAFFGGFGGGDGGGGGCGGDGGGGGDGC